MMRLALPVLAEHLLHLLVEYVDLWLTGNFLRETSYIAAIGLMSYVMWFVFNLFSFVSFGATAMTARFVGAGDRGMANRVANQAVLIGTIWALVLTVLGFIYVEEFVGLLNLQGEAAVAAVDYLRIVLLVIPAIMLEEVGMACLRGAGDMVSGLMVMTIVNVVNLIVSSSLLLGLGPFPELGWQGLAIGTACGHATGGLIVLVLLVSGRAGYRLRLRTMMPDKDLIRRLLRVGMPGGIDVTSVVLCHMWFVSIINQLGVLATAAHGVGVRIEALAYMPGAAFQIAATTLAGQYLGAKDFHRASRSVWMACLMGGGLMVTAGVVFYWAATPLSAFFVGGLDSPVVEISAGLLRIVAFTMPALALQMILSGALRGAGDTRWPLVFTFIGFLGIRIPLAYVLAYDSVQIPGTDLTLPGAGLGVYGAWYAMVVDVAIRCLLVVARFFHGGWMRTKV